MLQNKISFIFIDKISDVESTNIQRIVEGSERGSFKEAVKDKTNVAEMEKAYRHCSFPWLCIFLAGKMLNCGLNAELWAKIIVILSV